MPSRKNRENGNLHHSFSGTTSNSDMDSAADRKADAMMDISNGSYFGDGTRRTSSISPPSLLNSGPSNGRDFTTEELLEQIVNPYIEDDSPAAAALRANAEVHIGKMSKVARSINAQALRKFVKRASMRSHFGNVKGKPPRVPPGMRKSVEGDMDGSYKEQANIYGISEEGDYSDSDADEVRGDAGSYEPGNMDASVNSMVSEGGKSALSKASKSTVSSTLPTQQIDSKLSASPSTSPKRVDNDVQIKEPPPNIREHPGDHLHFSLQALKKESSLQNLVADGPQQHKDLPPEVVEGTMEAGKKVMKSVDPHDILKLTRWRRKKKKGNKKERKSYVVGKVIDGEHELYAQSIAVMLGVRTSIAKTVSVITADEHKKRFVEKSDFYHTEKYEFRPGGSDKTPPHQLSHTFKFKDYSPVVFAYLRRVFGVNEFDFLLSVCGNANFIEFISNAKSGQFFFYSSDGKYMIKTMTNAESKFLRRILPDYFRHCCANPNTMLTRFCGMYRVKLYHLRRNVKFVIMNSVFYTDKHLQEFYDLKGSIAGRTAKPGDQVLKDNDLRARLPEGALALQPEVRERVRRQLIRDCNFLQRNGVMDYSMLVGIHCVPPKQPGNENLARANMRASVRERRMSLNRKPGASMDSSDRYAPDSPINASVSNMRRSIHEMTDTVGLFDELDEDESSYLEGSEMRPARPANSPLQSLTIGSDIEKKKSQTIEQIYWPFHRLHDIHGNRRMKPAPCFHCKCVPCQCKEDIELLKRYNIPDFVTPLSDRKDGGFTMDTNGLTLPVVHEDQPYEGKIFYMGVIDILQEYNSRKVIESRYRMLQGMDALEASCVAPKDYAARFIKFFDMYSQRIGKKKIGLNTNAWARTRAKRSEKQRGFEQEGVEVEYEKTVET